MKYSTEDKFTKPSAWCANPKYWHAIDNHATEHEVSQFVSALVTVLQPECVVESGSYHGQTTAAIARAIDINGHGAFYSLEFDNTMATIARDVCSGLPVTILEADACTWQSPAPIDFAFVDSGPHKRVVHLRNILRQCRPGAIVAVHDTAPHKKLHRQLDQISGVRRIDLRTPRGLTLLEVLDKNAKPDIASVAQPTTTLVGEVPSTFRVAQIMAVYNEADVMEWFIRHAVEQGIDLYIYDNHSTDETYAIAEQYLGKGVNLLEKWGDAGEFALDDWDREIERVAPQIPAAWVIKGEPDWILTSPWRGITYREGLWHVQQAGYNLVDHWYLDFEPTPDAPALPEGEDFVKYFTHYRLRYLNSGNPFPQQRTWRNSQPVTIGNGGHTIRFDGAQVYPQKFLLRHYRYRSQEHGERKANERLQRRANDIRLKFSQHYLNSHKKNEFVKDPVVHGLQRWRPEEWFSDLEPEQEDEPES